MAKQKNPLTHEAEVGLLNGRLARQRETVAELRGQLKKDTVTIHDFRKENIRQGLNLKDATERLTRRDRTIKAMQDRARVQRDAHKEITERWQDETLRIRQRLDNVADVNAKLQEALANSTRDRLDLVEQLREAKIVLAARKSTNIIQEEGMVHIMVTDDPYEIKEPSFRPPADLSRLYRMSSTAPDMANIPKQP